MNKVVCDVCGTSYPENAAQCPICGYVHSSEKVGSAVQDGSESSYTYVKGGRFSKANVRKRNQSNQRLTAESPVDIEVDDHPVKDKSRTGMLIIIVALLLAIIAVVAYIAFRFFIPNDFMYSGFGDSGSPSASQSADATHPTDITEPAPTESDSVACESVVLSQSQIMLEAVGSTHTLNVTCTPSDTTDALAFTSSNPSVATVDDNGVITFAGEGTAVITVTCGNVTAECTVNCTLATTQPTVEEPADTFVLNRKEITFDSEGQSWVLYDGEIAVADIVWSSDDNGVATISDGKVVAVGNGDTTVYGVYEGQTVSCIIHCNFNEDATGSSGNVSEAGSESKRSYKLYNPYGNAEDVTIQVDEAFTLKLVDEDNNEISGAEWKSDDTACCSVENGVITGLASGTANVTATYEGATYTCVVRVK